MLNKNDYILVFDSGNGGQFVLDTLQHNLPFEKYILFKDVKFCPYGDKKKKELKENVTKILDNLTKKYKIKMIVIACNTISSLFKNYLLSKYSSYIILFVNPYLNDEILKNKTLVIATKNTIKYNKRLKKYAPNKNLFLLGFDKLAKIIDDNFDNLGTILPYIYTKCAPYLNIGIKNIVVGCTHYNYIIFLLQKIFKGAKFYESSLEVSKLAKILLTMYELESDDNQINEVLELISI